MKMIPHEEFLKLPEGILYWETKPQYFSGLSIKGETIGEEDWSLISLLPKFEEEFQLYEAYKRLENGESLTLDFIGERDAMYDTDRKFLIYEKKDLEILINKLKELL